MTISVPDIRQVEAKGFKLTFDVRCHSLNDSRLPGIHGPTQIQRESHAFAFFYNPFDANAWSAIEQYLSDFKSRRAKEAFWEDDIIDDRSRRSYGRYRYNEGPYDPAYRHTISHYQPDYKNTPIVFIELFPVGKTESEPRFPRKNAEEAAKECNSLVFSVFLNDQKSIDAPFLWLAERVVEVDVFDRIRVDKNKLAEDIAKQKREGRYKP